MARGRGATTDRWPPLRPLTLVVAVAVVVGLGVRLTSDAPLGGTAARWVVVLITALAAVLQVGALVWRWPRDHGRSLLAWTLLTVAGLLVYAGVTAFALNPEQGGFWLDVGYFAGSPLFAVALLILPAPPLRDSWEAALDALQGVVAALAVTVSVLWLLPLDLDDGLNVQEASHIGAVSGTVGVLVYVVMRQRRPGGIAVRQLELVIAAAAQVTAAAILAFRFDVLGTRGLAVAATLFFVTGCVTGAQAVGRDVVEEEGPRDLRRREFWAVALPGVALALGLGSLAAYAVTPDPVSATLGWPMVALVLTVVVATLALFLLSGREARRLRESAAERELQAVVQERWFRSLSGGSGDATVLVDLSGRVIFASATASDLLGVSAPLAVGRDLAELVELDLRDWRLTLADAARDPDAAATCAARTRPPHGSEAAEPIDLQLVVSVLADGGGLQAYVVALTDAHGEERLTETLRLVDGLTGLPNRLGFLRACAQTGLGSPGRSAVVVLDLVRFGLVNDAHGHQAGDELLRRVAEVVDACAACGGRVVGRVGGDEFAVLVEPEPTPGEDACAPGWLDGRVVDSVAHLLATLEPLADLRGDGLPMACHVGYSVLESEEQTADELLRHAEVATDRARAGDLQAPIRFDAEVHALRMAEVGLEVDLRRTLLAGGLTLYYQPIVDLATGRPEGVEALVRWHHPTRGLLGPDQFVGLAERAGLSDDLTRWVLGAALDDQSAFEQEVGRPLHIAVNVGPPSVTSRLPLLVDEALAQRSVPPGRMTVEVTETALFSAADDPAGVLAALRSAGVSVALDDFGTGFSSLSLLARMPVDVVKVDRSFVSRIEGAGDELALVRGLLQLCRTLRIRSVAEGVETQSQAELLLAMGADLAQGYLYARPMPREDVCRWLAERSPGRPVPAARRSGSGGPQPPAR